MVFLDCLIKIYGYLSWPWVALHLFAFALQLNSSSGNNPIVHHVRWVNQNLYACIGVNLAANLVQHLMRQSKKYTTICDYVLTISHDMSVIHYVKRHETPIQKLKEITDEYDFQLPDGENSPSDFFGEMRYISWKSHIGKRIKNRGGNLIFLQSLTKIIFCDTIKICRHLRQAGFFFFTAWNFDFQWCIFIPRHGIYI